MMDVYWAVSGKAYITNIRRNSALQTIRSILFDGNTPNLHYCRAPYFKSLLKIHLTIVIETDVTERDISSTVIPFNEELQT